MITQRTSMEDLPLVRVQRLLDLLGPGLWLTVDRSAFKRLFGHDIDPRGLKAAKDFARDCGCTFEFNADKGEIRFGSARTKQADMQRTD